MSPRPLLIPIFVAYDFQIASQINNNINYKMKSYEVVISLTNAMIGGLILVLPLLTLEGGILLTPLIILLTGFFSYYSCYICVIHLGNHEDLDKAFFHHFNQNRIIRIAYDVMVFIAILFGLLFFFALIIQQWIGLLGYNIAIPLGNTGVLFILVIILNYFHIGPKLMAYGLVSIVAYLIFLIWLLASAPSGSKSLPLFGTGAVSMASAMGQAYTIQAIFIPILRELPDTKNYAKYTLYTYIIGTVIYFYIAYMGAYGVVNRTPIQNPIQTIEGYFNPGDPEVMALQIVYLVHLYSAFGEFLLVSKKRFFGICSVKQSIQGQMFKIHEIVYVGIMIGICCTVYLTNLTIENLITINGGIIGFFFIYLMPAMMHLKCLYFSSHQNTEEDASIKKESIQLPDVESVTPKYSDIGQLQQHLAQLNQNQQTPQQNQQTPQQNKQIDLRCPCKKPSFGLQVIDIISMVGMISLGAFIMVDGFISVIS